MRPHALVSLLVLACSDPGYISYVPLADGTAGEAGAPSEPTEGTGGNVTPGAWPPPAGTAGDSAGSGAIGAYGGSAGSSGASGSAGTQAGTAGRAGEAGTSGSAGMGGTGEAGQAGAPMGGAGSSGGSGSMSGSGGTSGSAGGEAGMAGSAGSDPEPDPQPKCLLYRYAVGKSKCLEPHPTASYLVEVPCPEPTEECLVREVPGCPDAFDVHVPRNTCFSIKHGGRADEGCAETEPSACHNGCYLDDDPEPLVVRATWGAWVDSYHKIVLNDLSIKPQWECFNTDDSSLRCGCRTSGCGLPCGANAWETIGTESYFGLTF